MVQGSPIQCYQADRQPVPCVVLAGTEHGAVILQLPAFHGPLAAVAVASFFAAASCY